MYWLSGQRGMGLAEPQNTPQSATGHIVYSYIERPTGSWDIAFDLGDI